MKYLKNRIYKLFTNTWVFIFPLEGWKGGETDTMRDGKTENMIEGSREDTHHLTVGVQKGRQARAHLLMMRPPQRRRKKKWIQSSLAQVVHIFHLPSSG